MSGARVWECFRRRKQAELIIGCKSLVGDAKSYQIIWAKPGVVGIFARELVVRSEGERGESGESHGWTLGLEELYSVGLFRGSSR